MQIGRLFYFFNDWSVITIGKTIYIRNVDAGVLAKIDELAEKKNISRNKLVNIILESYITSDKIKESEDKYTKLITTIVGAIDNNTVALENLKQQIKEK